MNEQDVFRKLVLGVKFDQDKFLKNTQRFHKVATKHFDITDIKVSDELDFFKSEKSIKNDDTTNITEINKKTISDDTSCKNDLADDNSSGFEDSSKKPIKRKSENGSSQSKKIKSVDPAYLRKVHKIYIEGSDVPELITDFEQLQSVYKFNQKCLKNIMDKMGFSTLTPIQMQVEVLLCYEIFFKRF